MYVHFICMSVLIMAASHDNDSQFVVAHKQQGNKQPLGCAGRKSDRLNDTLW